MNLSVNTVFLEYSLHKVLDDILNLNRLEIVEPEIFFGLCPEISDCRRFNFFLTQKFGIFSETDRIAVVGIIIHNHHIAHGHRVSHEVRRLIDVKLLKENFKLLFDSFTAICA